MKGSSAYMKEDLLKRKFVATWNELCSILSISPEIEIIHDDGAPFSETPYPEINRRVQRLLRRDEFPDHFDICELIDRCNIKHNLAIGAEEKAQLSRKVFKRVGAVLKSRRQKDFKQHFGSHLTDVVKDSEDPALTDEGLLDRLKTSVKDGQAKLEEVCDGFVSKQEQDSEAGKSPEVDSCNTDNEDDEDEQEENVLDVLNETEGDLKPLPKRIKLTSSEDAPPPPDTLGPPENTEIPPPPDTLGPPENTEIPPPPDTLGPPENTEIKVTSKDQSETTNLSRSSSSGSFIDVESNSQSLSLPTEPISPSSCSAPVICLSDNDDEDSDIVIVSD